MTNGTENLGNGAVTDDRFATHLGYRGVARRDTLAPVPEPALSDPVLNPTNWLQSNAGALADHPLLHGLLMELPPKGATPDAAWLDRWFEAARSILELIYSEPTGPAAAHR
ncbi:MAG: hypothetical protein V7603_4277 [Micromonosporaceae bacterium]